jgi:predicted XRE-type DNA-binding protein
MPTPAKELLDAVRAILVRALTKPLTQKEVAELLGVQSKQAFHMAERSCRATSPDKDETANALCR